MRFKLQNGIIHMIFSTTKAVLAFCWRHYKLELVTKHPLANALLVRALTIFGLKFFFSFSAELSTQWIDFASYIYWSWIKILINALHERFPYSEFFWSVFSRIRFEYEEILCIRKILTRKSLNTDTFYTVTEKYLDHIQSSRLKGALLGLRQFLATESPLKMTKNAFYFTLNALLVLKIFKFLSWIFAFVEKFFD